MSFARAVAAFVAGRRTKWVVLVLWIIVLAVAGPLAGKLNGAENNQTSSWLPGSAESTKVFNAESAFQPNDIADTIVVYQRDSGLTPADLAKIHADISAYGRLQDLAAPVLGPLPGNPGAQVTVVDVPVHAGKTGWNAVSDAVTAMRTTATSGNTGLAVHITGPGGVAADDAKVFSGIDGTLLYATVGVVIVILLLTYRSPSLWLLPILSAGAALASAEAVIYLFARHAGLVVNAQSAGILTVLVFGAGTDYALLLTARYREELRRHEDRHEAMAAALHRSGAAIIASAATVIVSMLCLLVAEMNSTSSLGPVAAIGIAVGLLAMLTLYPALLVIVGRWVFWPVRPTYGTPEPTASGVWARIGTGIGHRPRTVWIVTALILGGMALGLTSLKANGLDVAGGFVNTPDSVVGQRVLADHGINVGVGQPVVVIARANADTEVKAAIAATPDVTLDTFTPAAVQPPVDGYVLRQGVFTVPPDSQAAHNAVTQLRGTVHALPGADALVGGGTATTMDIAQASHHDDLLLIPLILGVVLLILGLLLRSLVAPFVLIATVVLSFAAALGISSVIFFHGFHFEGADSAFPLFVFVFLVALGIDYNIFLTTRIREEAARDGTRRGALTALAATGGVITSAGLVLASTFGVLATLPAVAFAEIGFAVAFGVLLDTLIVRSVLVTALTLDIGRWMWWPSALHKHLDPLPEESSGALTPVD